MSTRSIPLRSLVRYQNIKFLKAKDLIKVLQENPECEIGFYDNTEESLLSPTEIKEEFYTEVSIHNNSDESEYTVWMNEKELEMYGNEYGTEFTGNKQKVIVLHNTYHFVPDLEKIQEQERLTAEEEAKKLKLKLNNFKDRVLIKDILFEDKIYLFLCEFKLGESGRGYEISEIEEIMFGPRKFEGDFSNFYDVENALKKLTLENKIKSTGNTKNKRYCIAELYYSAECKYTVDNMKLSERIENLLDEKPIG